MELIYYLISLFIHHKKNRDLFRKRYMKKYNNRYILIDENGKETINPRIKGLKIVFAGENSTIKIYKPCRFKNCLLKAESNDNITLKGTKWRYNNLKIVHPLSSDSNITIGENFHCGGLEIYSSAEKNINITIGDDCLFSANVLIRASDGHLIFNDKHQVINKGEDINIGNHVWVGYGAKFLKGSNVPDNSVVAMSSLYTKSSYTPPHLKETDSKLGYVFAGVPAKIVKTGITWEN